MRAMRVQRGWTQEELAARAGLGADEVAAVEANGKQMDSVRVVHGLASALSGGAAMEDYPRWLAGLIREAMK